MCVYLYIRLEIHTRKSTIPLIIVCLNLVVRNMSLTELSNTALVYACYRYGTQSCFFLEIADEASNFNTLFLLPYNSVKPRLFALKDYKREYLPWPPGLSFAYLCFFDV